MSYIIEYDLFLHPILNGSTFCEIRVSQVQICTLEVLIFAHSNINGNFFFQVS